jgi:rhamnosyltransferase
MQKVAAVVVLYNPEDTVIKNLNSYVDQVDKLYVIDNSDKVNNYLIEQIMSIKGVDYTWNKKNLGIAQALNLGARKAIEEKFDYLLTMDQDSEAPPLMVSNLLDCFLVNDKVASVAPLLLSPAGRKVKIKIDEPCEQVLTVWTSGNLLNLEIFKVTDGFRDDFFIDYVDHEFCLRLIRLGFKIYLCHKVTVKHHLGNIEEINLFFRKIYPTHHSPLRLYYRTRNRFYVKKIYKHSVPEFFKGESLQFWKSYLKVVLFEKDRIKKIKYIINGYRDFKRNIFGKFEDIHGK